MKNGKQQIRTSMSGMVVLGLIVSGFLGIVAMLGENAGAATVEVSAPWYEVGNWPQLVVLGDVNNDTYLDIVTVNTTSLLETNITSFISQLMPVKATFPLI